MKSILALIGFGALTILLFSLAGPSRFEAAPIQESQPPLPLPAVEDLLEEDETPFGSISRMDPRRRFLAGEKAAPPAVLYWDRADPRIGSSSQKLGDPAWVEVRKQLLPDSTPPRFFSRAGPNRSKQVAPPPVE